MDTFDNFALPGLRGETNQWSGRTWYRKTFDAPKDWQGKKIYIEFDAVRQVAQVYLNGHYLGACKNGFLPFGFDLTPYPADRQAERAGRDVRQYLHVQFDEHRHERRGRRSAAERRRFNECDGQCSASGGTRAAGDAQVAQIGRRRHDD